MAALQSVKSAVVKAAVAGVLAGAAVLGAAGFASAAQAVAGVDVAGQGETAEAARQDAADECMSGDISDATYTPLADEQKNSPAGAEVKAKWSVKAKCK